MKKLILIVLFILFFVNNFYSQGENNNWYFGSRAALNFATTPPTVLSDSNMVQLEGVASISDANGNLLFYSNGMNVWDKNHNIMPNGNGLLGNFSTTQSVVIVPFPGISNRYYLFTCYVSQVTSNPYNYSVIDMNLNNGFGDVISNQKNIPLLNEFGLSLQHDNVSDEAMTYTFNNIKDAYWLLIPITFPVNKLYAYKIDSSGITSNPTTSNLDFHVNDFNCIGCNFPYNSSFIKVSNDRKRVVISKHYTNKQLKLYTFDDSIGKIINLSGNCNNCDAYSTEFSFNDNLLYYSSKTTGGLNVIDMNGNYRQIVSSNFEAGLQRAKNNVIYLSKLNPNLEPGIVTDITNKSDSMFSPSLFANNYLYQISNSDSFSLSNLNFANQIYLGVNSYSAYGLPQLNRVISPSTCIPYRVLNNFYENNNVNYAASIDIRTENNYTVNELAIVSLKAGNSVTLMPNTYVKSNSDFIAKIEPCTYLNKSSSNPTEVVSKEPFVIDVLKRNTLISDLTVYPNPVKNGVFYINSDANAVRTVTVYDVVGKQVLNTTTSNSAVNVSSLNAGIYMVKITEEGKTATKKLVIE